MRIRKIITKNCKQCDKEIILDYINGRKLFCNHSCAAKYNNLGIKRNGKNTLKCPECSGVKDYKSKICKLCYGVENRDSISIEKWFKNEINGNGKYGLKYFVRRFIFKRDKNKCIICGFSDINPYSNKSILQIDHIDGNWTNCSSENLRLLCPNCHAKTEFYGALNMNRGRKWKFNYKQF